MIWTKYFVVKMTPYYYSLSHLPVWHFYPTLDSTNCDGMHVWFLIELWFAGWLAWEVVVFFFFFFIFRYHNLGEIQVDRTWFEQDIPTQYKHCVSSGLPSHNMCRQAWTKLLNYENVEKAIAKFVFTNSQWRVFLNKHFSIFLGCYLK